MSQRRAFLEKKGIKYIKLNIYKIYFAVVLNKLSVVLFACLFVCFSNEWKTLDYMNCI